MRSSHSLDRVRVTFDDKRLVANAGLIAPATLAQHLGLRDLFDEHVDLGDAPGRANVGDKALTVVHAVLAGADSIDDCEVLRAGASSAVVGHAVLAPSTIGIYLRSFTWGHARQLDTVAGELLVRAWTAGAGPGAEAVTIDVDSSICETYGLQKQGGTRFTYTHVRGYHPLFATVAGTSDVVHSRLRGGNAHTARGAPSFLAETFARVRAAGATGPLSMRGDSGFYAKKVVDACGMADVRFSITVKLSKSVHAAISKIDPADWTPIPYFLDDGADVAECSYRAFGKKNGVTCRLIVRRTRPTPGSQLALLVDYSYHAFITDRVGDKVFLDAEHRRHAVVENAIRDLKYGVGLNHLPSGRFGGNAAWLAFNVMAHNMARWTSRLGGLDTTDAADDPTVTGPAADHIPVEDPTTPAGPARKSFVATDTLRRHHLCMPGRVSSSARKLHLHLPTHWPWADAFNQMLANLRSVTLLT
jgi:hypothetical protein